MDSKLLEVRAFIRDLDSQNCPVERRQKELREAEQREQARKAREQQQATNWYSALDERIDQHFKLRFGEDGDLNDAIGGALAEIRAQVRTSQHLSGELFKIMTGTDMVHVPYRGAPQALTDLLSGQVQACFEPMPASIELIKSGKLRPLAVTTGTRSEALPELPSVSEFVPAMRQARGTACLPRRTRPLKSSRS